MANADKYYSLNYFEIETQQKELVKINPKLKINPLKNSNNYYSAIKQLLRDLTDNYNPKDQTVNLNITKNLKEIYEQNPLKITPTEIDINTTTAQDLTLDFEITSYIPIRTVKSSLQDNQTNSQNNLMNINRVIGTARAYVNTPTLIYNGQTETEYNYTLSVRVQIEEGYDYEKSGRPSRSLSRLYFDVILSEISLIITLIVKVNIITE